MMGAAGLTPEIVDRVASWLRQRPAPSARMSALCGAFERRAQGALALGRYRNERDQAEAAANEAAALGCLLALVREAWVHADANACKTSDGRFWGVRCPGFACYMGTGDTETEALLAALESAP